MVDMKKGVNWDELAAALAGDPGVQEQIFHQLRPLWITVVRRFWKREGVTDFADFENAAFVGMMEGIEKFAARKRPVAKLYAFVKWEVFRQCKILWLQERAFSCPSGLHLGQLNEDTREAFDRAGKPALSLEVPYGEGGDWLVETIPDGLGERPTEEAAIDRVWRKQVDRIVRETAAQIGLDYSLVQRKRCEAMTKKLPTWRAFAPVDREALGGVLPLDLI